MIGRIILKNQKQKRKERQKKDTISLGKGKRSQKGGAETQLQGDTT